MLNSMGGGMSQIGGSITRNVTLPLLAVGAGTVALGGMALKTGAEYEKAMSGVSAILGATSQEQEQLNDLGIQLGMDPKLIVTASQAAGVMEELAKNGLSTQDILGGAADGAIALANATGTDFSTAAQIASTSMQLFGIDAGNMKDVVDQVTAVANTSRFTAEDFAQAVGMGGAAAVSAGVDFDEFTATVSALSVATSSGSDAGTSFKTFLTRLTPSTEKAAKLMEELGLVTEEGGNAFYDASGNLKSMADIAGVLDTTFSGMTEMQRANTLEVLFGSDASRAAIGLMQTGKQGFEDLMTSMAQTDAADNAATRMDNLSGAAEIAGGVLEGFQIKFSQAIGPGVRTMIESFSTFLTNNSGSIESLFLSLSTVFDNFGKNFGPWLDQNGPKIIEFFGKMIESLPGFIDKLVEVGTVAAPYVKQLFDAFMDADPATITNIMGAIAGLGALGPILMGLGGAITVISSVMSIIGTIGGIITGAVVGPLLLIIATLGLVVYAFATDFGGITTTVIQMVFIVKFYFEQMATWILDNVKKAGDFITTKFAEMKTTIKQLQAIFEAVSTGVRNAIGKMITKIGDLASKLLGIKIPAWLMPGSPTPFEIGLLGIVSAMDKVNKTGLPGLGGSPSMPVYTSSASGNNANGSAAAGNKNVIINITNPKKETSEESVAKTLNRLSYLRVLE